ncbi:TIR domain-containing protein [Deinococcus sp. 6GRE01]|uniref:TIR domain-containing protein n=1 Tax=Deinococcus sp. 6GRE01 TaxID=2745873 RepID=UPI001E40E352|nr:TIR domain-containing protein [Deinococcus sp. 6GRE01]MCD0156320.1 TIR domain-containing protein [Deinococcus sp. 6GRE01]
MPRRVFFSFHYDDVISFRANVVRNSFVVRRAGIEETNFYDHSIWEEARLKGAAALTKLVDDALHNSSVSCVLIGSETYNRPWVRYEIARSFARGNGLIGIHINSVKDKHQATKPKGNNPFDYLHYHVDSTTGLVHLSEWALKNGTWQWVSYSKLPNFRLSSLKYSLYGSGQLSDIAWIYDWVANDGYNNLGAWSDSATVRAGR